MIYWLNHRPLDYSTGCGGSNNLHRVVIYLLQSSIQKLNNCDEVNEVILQFSC